MIIAFLKPFQHFIIMDLAAKALNKMFYKKNRLLKTFL